MTMTDTLPMPAHKTRHGFPLVNCTRCGGSGHYSYNAMHGSTCYGCGGTGWKIARPAAKYLDEFTLAQRRGWEVTANPTPNPKSTCGTITVGDEINRQKGDDWMTVAAIDIDYTDERGWSSPPGWDGRSPERIVTAWAVIITMTDGTEWATATNIMYRRRRATDAAPYVAKALAAWRRAGCPGGTK
jgi:hypothetical protein